MAVRSMIISSLGNLINIKIGEDNQTIILDLIDIDCLATNEAGLTLKWQDESSSKGNFQSIICAGCVMSNQMFIKLPFLAVTSEIQGRNGKVKRITIFVLLNGQICKVKSFPLPFSLQQNQDRLDNYEFHMFDGPTIFMLERSRSHGFLGRMDLHSIFEKTNLCPEHIESGVTSAKIKCFSDDPMSQSLSAIIELTMTEAACRQNVQHEYISFPLDNDQSERVSLGKDIHAKSSPPKLYIPMITAFIVFKKKDLYHWDIKISREKNQDKLFAISTENKQFLIFNRNESMMCCSIPLEDCIKISLVKLPNKETAFFLISKSSDSCLVSWKEKKVIQHWNNIQDVFFDDFLGVGHKQILILFSKLKFSDDVQFYLTDLLCCENDSRLPTTNEKHQDSQVENSLSSVVDAISANIQAVKTEIHDNEVIIQRNNSLIKETWQSFENMIINGESTQEKDLSDDGLVSFFDSTCDVSDEKQTSSKSSRPFVVLEQKQATVFEKWVVIIKLKIVSERPITCWSMSIIAENLNSESYVISLTPNTRSRSSNFGNQETQAKKNKQDHTSSSNLQYFHCDQEITLSAKTDVPDFSRNNQIKAMLMVSWEEWQERNEDTREISCIVGSAELSSVDVIKGTYKTDDRVFYESAAVNSGFRITSPNFQLTSLESLVRDELKKTKCKIFVSYEDQPTDFEKTNADDEYFEIYLIFSKSKMSVEVKMFSRNTAEANQLRHVITSLVPKNSEITLPMSIHNDLVSRLAKSMENELSVLEKLAEQTLEAYKSTGVDDIEKETTQNDNYELSDCTIDEHSNGKDGEQRIAESTTNKVEEIRRNFQRKRKRNETLLKDIPTVELDSNIYKHYLKAMQETDNIAAILFSLQEDELPNSSVFNW